MSILIGQISYMPNTDVRSKRLEASRAQLAWFNKVLPNEKIVSVCQQYTSDEMRYICDNFDNVEICSYPEPIGAGAARNVILEKFYESDYDWLFLCDDDTIIDDKYSAYSFITDVARNPYKFQDIDAISAVEPEYHPYKKLNFEDERTLTHYKFEPRELNSGSATSLIRNIKKYYKKEIYYPNVDANKGEGREDMEFLFAWLKSGLNWYTMQTMIRKSLCFDKSSIFGSDTKERDKILMHDLDVICERYAEDGINRGVGGKITWKNFNERYNTSHKFVYITRRRPIKFDESTTPKPKVDNSQNLF